MITETAHILQIILAAVFFGFFVLMFVYLLKTPKVFDGLLTDGDKGSTGSMSRFQLLLFTFVIAGLYLVLCIENGQFVEIPGNVLGLLGISGGSFVLSKGIGANATTRKAEAEVKAGEVKTSEIKTSEVKTTTSATAGERKE